MTTCSRKPNASFLKTPRDAAFFLAGEFSTKHVENIVQNRQRKKFLQRHL